MAETPAPDANHPFDPARPASSSLLFYLFSDRALPQTPRGTPVPLSAGHVDTSLLANLLFTSALWRLCEAGFVRLEAVEQRIDQGLLVEQRVPVRQIEVCSNDCRDAAVALIQVAEQLRVRN